MRNSISDLFVLFAVALGLGACQAPSGAPTADYTFVFIKTGPAQGLTREESQRLFQGHFSNMKRLAATGDLLVAGPLGSPRAEPDHRGVFVFDTAELTEAHSLAATDPAGQAGVFVFEYLPWCAGAALRRLPALDAELVAELPEDAGPGATARAFVLVRCADADRAERALAPLFVDHAVLFFGRLSDESPQGALFALDAVDLDAARQMLARAEGAPADFWQLLPWFASKSLVELPKLID